MSLPVVHQPRRIEEVLGALIDSKELELSSLQRGYLRARWLEQVRHIDHELHRVRRSHHALRVITLIGCLVLLMLVSLSSGNQFNSNWASTVRAITVCLSLLVATSLALEFIFNLAARRHQLQQRLERLQAEGWRFLQLSGHYGYYENHASAFTTFANQVEDLSQREVEVYNSSSLPERRREDFIPEAVPAKKLPPLPEQEQPAMATAAAQPLHAMARTNSLALGAGQTRM